MAILRELITIVSFEVEGVNKVDAAIGSIKTSLLALGKLFGIAFAADKVFEWVDELTASAKEVAKLQYQLTRMARAGDDIPTAMSSIFDIAQATGIEYTHVLDTYREFLNESKESNVSQQQLLDTVSNIYKTMRLGAVSGDKMQEVLRAFNLGFRRGAIGMRQWGLIVDEAPDLVDALGKSIGKSRKEMEEMAKAGKLTADVIVNGLGKSLDQVNREFANRPRKLAEAFTYAWNEAVRLATAIWRIVNTTGRVANAIIWLTKTVVSSLKTVTDFFGGLEKTIEAVGIMAAVALGPKLIFMLQAAVIGTTRWIAANFIVIAQYAAMAAAVFAVFLAIEDIMVWMRGGDSVIGDWLGPFEKFKEDFKKTFDMSDFFAPFKAFQDLIEGDFAGAWEKLKQSIVSVNGVLGIMLLLLPTIWLAFRLWNTLQFFGLIAALRGVVEVIALISSGAIEAVANMIRLARAGVLMRAGPIGMAALLAMEGWDALRGRNKGDIARPLTDDEKKTAPNTGSSWLPDWFTKQRPGLLTPTTPETTPSASSWKDTIRNIFPGAFFDRKLTPEVTPGQVTGAPSSGLYVGPGATNNNNQAVNQTNNVTIQVDPTLDIAGKITGAVSDMWDAFGRQARNAMPVTESPTQ